MMNSTQTLDQLNQLRLSGMAGFYQTQLEQPVHQQLDAHEMIAAMTQTEILHRGNERMAYYLKLAKL